MNKFLRSVQEMTSVRTKDGSTLTLKTLFFPIFVETALKNLMSTVNVFILSGLSDDAVASVGVASQIFTIMLMVFTVCGAGATVVISQNIGAGKNQRSMQIASTAILLTVLLSCLIGVTAYLGAPVFMRWMQLEAPLIPDAVKYLRVLGQFCIFQAIITILSAIARSYGKTKSVMYVSLLMNVLNAAGGWIVIARPFETPLYGVEGVAIARILSEAAAMVMMIFLFVRMRTGIRFRLREALSLRNVKDILYIAIPNCIESLSYNLSQTVTTAIVAILGAAAISAKIYVQNVVIYVYIFGMALGQANAILVGRLAGAGENDRAYRLGIMGLKVTMVSNGLLSVIAMLFRYQLIGLFTNDSVILSIASTVMILDIFVEIGRGFNHIMQGSLRAVSDVKIPTLTSIVTSWCCSILLSYVLGVRLGMGLTGCWCAYAVEELTRGTILITRWRSKKWQNSARLKRIQLN